LGKLRQGVNMLVRTAQELLPTAQELRETSEQERRRAMHAYGSDLWVAETELRHLGTASSWHLRDDPQKKVDSIKDQIGYRWACWASTGAAAHDIEQCADRLLSLIHISARDLGYGSIPAQGPDRLIRSVPRERPAVTARRLGAAVRGTILDQPVPDISRQDEHPPVSQVMDWAASRFTTGHNEGHQLAAHTARVLANIAIWGVPDDGTGHGCILPAGAAELAEAARRLATGPGTAYGPADGFRQLASDIRASPHGSGNDMNDAARQLDRAVERLAEHKQDQNPRHLRAAARCLDDAAAVISAHAGAERNNADRQRQIPEKVLGTQHEASFRKSARLAQAAADDSARWEAWTGELKNTLLSTMTAPASLASAPAHRPEPPRKQDRPHETRTETGRNPGRPRSGGQSPG
jgi:hypothetical protein